MDQILFTVECEFERGPSLLYYPDPGSPNEAVVVFAWQSFQNDINQAHKESVKDPEKLMAITIKRSIK